MSLQVYAYDRGHAFDESKQELVFLFLWRVRGLYSLNCVFLELSIVACKSGEFFLSPFLRGVRRDLGVCLGGSPDFGESSIDKLDNESFYPFCFLVQKDGFEGSLV